METKGAATVFHVTDIARSVSFFVETLGFSERFRAGDQYIGVEYGEVQIHLMGDNARTPAGAGQLYIFVDNVDAYYNEIVDRGATPNRAPGDEPYGMRDFEVADPDGNLLAFGAEVENNGS